MRNRNKPLVSIIIVTWNRKNDLSETLLKLEPLLSEKIEIIVVDNDSNDGTADLIRTNFPNIILISLSENVGHAIGVNEGFKLAKGKHLLLLDDDAYIKQKDLNIMIEKFESDPNLGIVAFNIIDLKSRQSQWQNLDLSIVEKNSNGSYPFFTFLGCGAGVRREAFVKAGRFKDYFFMCEEEFELAVRILIAGYDVRYYPNLFIYHDVSPKRGKGGMLGSRIDYNVRNSLWIIWQYFPFWKALDLTIGYLIILLIQSFRFGVPNLWLKGLISAFTQRPHNLKRTVIPEKIQYYYKPYFREYSFTGRISKELSELNRKVTKAR